MMCSNPAATARALTTASMRLGTSCGGVRCRRLRRQAADLPRCCIRAGHPHHTRMSRPRRSRSAPGCAGLPPPPRAPSRP
eukprot:5864559-Prymnesium_polylepis.1